MTGFKRSLGYSLRLPGMSSSLLSKTPFLYLMDLKILDFYSGDAGWFAITLLLPCQ